MQKSNLKQPIEVFVKDYTNFLVRQSVKNDERIFQLTSLLDHHTHFEDESINAMLMELNGRIDLRKLLNQMI
jgi:hypothetical protein